MNLKCVIKIFRLVPYLEAVHDNYLYDYELNGKRRSNRRSVCIYSNIPNSIMCLFIEIKRG